MEHGFWHEKWEENEIGFHQPKPHPQLVRYLPELKLAPGARVFLPLCGKTLDIHWLLAEGFEVIGAELSEIAITQLFEELGVEPEITETDRLKLYAANKITIFVGDIFALTADDLGPIDAIYDRAALVALPDDMRAAYVKHLPLITGTAPQLLISFDYDQSVMPGPPFSVPETSVRAFYDETYAITRLASAPVKGGLKGFCPAEEDVWLLKA